jgi:hypothetical protein
MTARALRAALELVATGIPAFPFLLDKRPSCPHGFKDATTDPENLNELWQQYPGELVGVPTGSVSGIDALDLDAKHAEAIAWMKENRRRFPKTRTHRTRSGGAHLLFQHNDTVTCTVAKIALGVDTRANGGYVIWWPAADLPIVSDAAPASWPDWLLSEFRPKPQPPRTAAAIVSRGDGWLRGLVRIVAKATEGQRNRILFWASCRAGEAVRDGKAGENFVIDVLVEAAARAGLPEREAKSTIRSGMQRT